MPVESSKYNFGNASKITFQAEEGARTMSDAEVDPAGGTKRIATFLTPIVKGAIVSLDSVNSRNWTVQQRLLTEAVTIVGIAHDKARFQNFDALAWLVDAANPDEEEQRSVSVEIFGLFTRAIQIATGETLSELGESVQLSAIALKVNEWKQDTTRNGTFTLVKGTLNAKDTVVMFLYDGEF